jgi:hypothetical protein
MTRARETSENLRLAKVFGSVDLNGGVGGIPIGIGADLNISSYDDEQAGSCGVNFETPMSDANYTVVCSPREIDGLTNTWTAVTRSHTSSYFYLVVSKYNNATTDLQVSFIVFGD